ncbi:MAG: PKD domain-containing protein [Bacteroidota bacterium]
MNNSLTRKLYSWMMVLGLFICISACEENSEEEEILPDLEFALTVSDYEIKAGDNVTYSIDGFDPEKITYAWTFEGGEPATSTDLEPIVTYNTPGKYGASLTITRVEDERTFEASLPDSVTVSELAAGDVLASFVSDVKDIEQGGTVTYTSNSTSGTALVWTFQGGNPSTSTAEKVTVKYSNTGNFDVKLVVSLEGATDTKESTDYVSVSPLSANFTSTTTSIEEGMMVTYTSTSSEGATLAWVFEGGTPPSASANQVTVTYQTAGNYDVTLTASKNGLDFKKQEADYITVSEPAAPPAPSPASLESTTLSNDGLTISLKFDKDLNDPSGDASNMVVNVDSSPATISTLSLASGDATTIIVELSTAVTAGQSISITYAPGITTTEGLAVNSLSGVSVTNTLPTGNIIADGGVTSDFDSGTTGWDLTTHPFQGNQVDGNLIAGASISHDATGGFGGTGALKVVMNEGGVIQINNPSGSSNKNNFFVRTTNSISYESGKQYKIFVRFKVVGSAGFKSMTVRLKKANGAWEAPEQKKFLTNNPSGNWQTVEGNLSNVSGSTVGDGVIEIQMIGEEVTSGNGETTTVYFDDISITEVTP